MALLKKKSPPPDPAAIEAVSLSDMALVVRRQRQRSRFWENAGATIERIAQAELELHALKAKIEDAKKELASQENAGVQAATDAHKKTIASLRKEVQDVKQDIKRHQNESVQVKQDISDEINALTKEAAARKTEEEVKIAAVTQELEAVRTELTQVQVATRKSHDSRRTTVVENEKKIEASLQELAKVNELLAIRQKILQDTDKRWRKNIKEDYEINAKQ
jgi:predicted  nucleic acid-binding Zn-ribbon protein